MGFYKDREGYNRLFAQTHYQIKHEHPASVEDETPRQSFFRINDEEELEASCKNWVHFPCLAMVGLSGGPMNKGGSIRQGNNNILMFLHNLQLDTANPVEATAISEAYDITFNAMEDYIAKLASEYAEDDGCGTFKNIELSRFKWEQTGPIGDGLYGWILEFSDEIKNSKLLRVNPAHFIEPA